MRRAIEARPRRGTAEIWNLANASSDRVLAARGHLEGHQTLSRGGRSLPPEEIAREDVAWLGPGEAVRTFRRFHDFIGRYPTHCQNLAQGDHALMFMWRVVA